MKALKLLCIVPSLFVSCANPGAPAEIDSAPPTAGRGPAPVLTAPMLLSPPDGAVLDNGCNNPRTDSIVWEFDWADVPGATRYHLMVEHLGDSFPAVNVFTTLSSFRRVDQAAYIIEQNRFNWVWKVEAEIDGIFTGHGESRMLSVEPLNADCP